MPRRYDHIDLRVRNLAGAAAFYEMLLPALGFTRRVAVDGWLQYEHPDEAVGAFFGVTESADHRANENRIAFWAESVEEVERLAEIARKAGARNMEGPMPYEPGYFAVFFEDRRGRKCSGRIIPGSFPEISSIWWSTLRQERRPA
jgi:predicted enzyme related to lactoylglutathione lyase